MIKNRYEINKIRFAAKVVANILEKLRSFAQKPNMNGIKLAQIATQLLLEANCQSNFLNYHGFPSVLCVSINDELVHGIPNKRRFKPGDLITLDFGCKYRNYHADAALSFTIGPPSDEVQRLLQATRQSLNYVIKKLKPGMKINQIGCIIEKYITARGYYLTAKYVGHGIGRQLHEFPPVFNVCRTEPDLVLQPGMILCIEPMVLTGTTETIVNNDRWTVRSANGKLTCHFEKMVLITQTGVEILSDYAD